MTATQPEIQQKLGQLKRWIRRYVFLEGLAITVALACLLFWITFGLDLAYFQFSHLELPVWFRTLCVIAMSTLLTGAILVWIVLRLFRRLRSDELALALERRFPQLNDRLITTVQKRSSDSPLQESMLQRTAREAVSRLEDIEVRETFDPSPLKRMTIIAGVLFASVLALGLTHAQAMERWYNAYIKGDEKYWEPFRKQALTLHVVAQPGDRIREFDELGVYKHPRGVDLQLVASSTEQTLPPEQVLLQSMSFGSTGPQRSRVTMSRMGDREFRHTIGRVSQDLHVWIRGGDYTNRHPFRIQVVDPPRVDSLALRCQFPDYTGLADRTIPVSGVQTSLPMETLLELVARVNKPLRAVQLRCPDWEFSFGFELKDGSLLPRPTKLVLTNPETGDLPAILLDSGPNDFFTQDRLGFRVPLQISARAREQLDSLQESAALPLWLPPDSQIQITMEDEDQIFSPEPALLTILGIVDQPPVVDVRRTGVGVVVTRMAQIPLAGKITDDYGVAESWFGYQVDQSDLQRREFARPSGGEREFLLRGSADQDVEMFNLIPLKLEEGQSLSLAVHARDDDHLNGPHVSHGEFFTFKIVSKEELLARLYDREVTLRSRFEQIRAEINDLKAMFDQKRPQLAELDQPAAAADLLPGISAFVDRSLHQARKNHTESRGVEVSFGDLRDEMVNNRVQTEELLERIERRVIEPLSLLNGSEFLELDRRLGVLRLTLDRKAPVAEPVAEIGPAFDSLLAGMDAILAEMRDRGTFNELIQELQQMIDRQKKLLDETENQRIEENFFQPLN